MLVLPNTLFPLSGYRIIEQIYWGSKTSVYRGIREQDQKPVVIKLMRNEYPTFQEIAQFRNQYTITKNLNLEGIVQPLILENYRNGYALVMEDFGGISLKEWIQRHESTEGYCLGLSEFFHIAIAIAATLEKLHCHRIIHKDIKPANILINPYTQEVRLIDFSIATLLPREIQFLTNPHVLEGTIAYISPEQTGRMNRGIDYRSDFYSLGVTFFELLTGQLPFTNTDPMELIYSHIAKKPPNLDSIKEEIPPILSDIVMKLMAKNAEDRYQSAHGLKHDLEVCRDKWQNTGYIALFKLAVKDISNRFLIPEKLYGRQLEVTTLLAAFERVTKGTTEMVLVKGLSGIGKTAVVHEVHKPIVRQQSYFITGKFDQFQRDIPLSGLVQAFQDLIRQILLATDEQIQQWKAKILSALGEQAQVIIDVIPELELIIGKQSAVTQLSGNAAQNRFNFLLQKFVQIFSTKEQPLVIFLDDLQWADTASLRFIQSLMSHSNAVKNNSSLFLNTTKENICTTIFEEEFWEIDEIAATASNGEGLLLIGAYRDNEIYSAHPLALAIQEIEKTGTKVSHIVLTPLNQNHLNMLIADTLCCREEIAVSLSQMVFAKTKGNPFFTTQFLKSLHQDGIIKFNFDVGYWQYDIEKLQASALTDDVVEFMAMQIKKLPKMTQEVLQLAACIGNEFDLKTLAIIHEKSVVDTASHLWSALHEGIILPQTEIYKLFQGANSDTEIIVRQLPHDTDLQIPKYKFIHDRVQQAAYSLIPENQRQQIHLKIGLLLLKSTPVIEREEKIFLFVNQFNIALEFITDQHQRDELAQMNLVAGRKALASTAYPAALKYLKTGICLLPNEKWESHYGLTLALYETTAEAAYLAGDFAQMEEFVQVVLVQAKTLLEQVKVYEIKIQAYTSQNRLLEAIAIAKDVLKQFGVNFPDKPNELHIQQELEATNAMLTETTMDDLHNLPLMSSVEHLTIMRIVSSMIPATYLADPLLFPLLILSQVKLSVHYGNAPLSAFCYACYGILLNGIKKDIEAADQFGQLALSLLANFNYKEITAKTLFVVGAFIVHGKSHIRETLPILLEGYQTAMEVGNLEFVGYCAKDICQHSYLIGQELLTLEQEIQSYTQSLNKIKQTTTSNYCQIYWRSVHKLLGKSETYDYSSGEKYNEDENLTLFTEANDITGLHYFYFHKLILCYFFHDFEQAREKAEKFKHYLAGGTGFVTIPIFYFYDSLIALAISSENKSDLDNLLTQVADNQAKLKQWADHAPMNYLHKFYLVAAENHRIMGQYVEAIECYESAISLARENNYIHEEALANELAAKFYFAWGKMKIAQVYITDAYYCYSRWGAKAKVDDLAKRYPQLLTAIIQQEKISHQKRDEITFANYQSISNWSNHQTVIGSQKSIADSLDLATLIKASQVLSGKIELEQLLATLMQVVMENAGASKAALILHQSDNLGLSIAAISSSSSVAPISIQLPLNSLESSDDVPITLINYVKRSLEIFVTDDAKTVTFLSSDRYIIREQPKSLLCIPIINQGKLLGVLYLENNLTTGVFTRDRLEVLKLLTTQAAISLENAMLYQNVAQANQSLEEYSHSLEAKVEYRTQELYEKNQHLQQALQELKRTQTQLIQSEKMSSLGQMVAGIAHEINNPINFIHGNITYASAYIQSLLELIAVYQQEYPQPTNRVKQKAAAIELDYLLEDLPNIIESMKSGSSRISHIILGLRNFSRLDESEMKPVDIHEGIDNTLMILQHRLNANDGSPKIQVVKDYGQLPQITCYAGQLNQVFMNIISNAIDVLDESLVNVSIINQPTTIDHPTICIRTELTKLNTVQIRIADNGAGMTEEVRQKIFDPFFTTKTVGTATGLGLSISYQVIVEQHKGKLTCNSAPIQGTEFIIEIPNI
ncbi:ATP-binding sensor histidine kinase [Nostoc sp. TCL26-01]|uniref:trifunctional serine/threonine-protein kinase/ATP-binding protein/sensor histidine kinase n=1 Tax=Nostoc sp. TCL26-01 TaxID=2576904 RepID=UPI0015B986AD|nr:ATP-binding sensor histidine kinase [Nostoc sp. TCL26-01]QLE57648.1 GAF domain-containing protein [Nostoc sp. TCL26-01]